VVSTRVARPVTMEMTVFSSSVLGENWLSMCRVNSKWTENLNTRAEVIDVLMKSIMTLDLAMIFFGCNKKHRQLKEKFTKLEHFKSNKNIYA
jgi:hypothetical protein